MVVYDVLYDRADVEPHNYSAFVKGLPILIVWARDLPELKRKAKEAIRAHIGLDAYVAESQLRLFNIQDEDGDEQRRDYFPRTGRTEGQPGRSIGSRVDVGVPSSVRQRYFYGTGRRKSAVARVRLYPGDGRWVINGETMDDYFGRPADGAPDGAPTAGGGQHLGRFNVSVQVVGGGVTGRAGAMRHGIARALVAVDGRCARSCKRQGLLTRDPRVKERKKPGLKRARKAPQFTKR